MIEIVFALIIFSFVHWLADFVFQKSEWQETKSSSFSSLTKHTAVYGLIIYATAEAMNYFGAFGAQSDYAPLEFGLIQCFSHTLIDFFSSKLNKYLWQQKRTHDFFVSIGFDQFLHFTIMYLSIYYIFY